MELPALLPKKFVFVSKAENDQALFQRLLRSTEDLVAFFEAASADETWCEKHEDFIKLTLGWLTNQFFQDKLDLDFANRIKEAFQAHYPILHSLLPRNILVQTKGNTYEANSLMLGASSSYLKDLLIRECRDKNQRILVLSNINEEQISYLINYMHTGNLRDLWRHERQEILSLLKAATKWHLEELSRECQQILKRYLTKDNLVETLILAQKMRWFYLKQAACAYHNQLELGSNLYARDMEHLGFEFFNFLDKTWTLFLHLAPWITHLIFRNRLTLDRQFGESLKKCSNLISLDISGTEEESPYLEAIPKKLQELLAARCSWLKDENFASINAFCPALNRLDLSQNTQLSYKAFGELKKFLSLKSLNLSLCNQIGDEELALITEAVPGLISIDISGCKRISEAGLFNLIQMAPRLSFLAMGRLAVSDKFLAELANRLRLLESLDLTHCDNLTERSLSDLLRNRVSLSTLNLSECRLLPDFVDQLRRQFPKVKIID